MNRMLRFAVALLLAALTLPACADGKVKVYAAASLTNALGDIAAAYEARTGTEVLLSFAAASALARQIENGAPADVFISADVKWMDYLRDKGRIVNESRRNLVGNSLVIIAPKGRTFAVKTEKGFDFAGAFKGKLCTGDPEHVPVGIYAKEALMTLGWWGSISTRIVGTEDVRAALAFVEKGECAAGIVYETDARISRRAEVLAKIPEETHDPITYSAALVRGGNAQAGRGFLDFLSTAPARTIFVKYGFVVPGK